MRKKKLVAVLALTCAMSVIMGLTSCFDEPSESVSESTSASESASTSESTSTTESTSTSESTHVHTYIWHEGTAATCTTDGKAGYYSCDGCDLIFDSEKNETTEAALKINKKGHNFVDNVCANGCGADISVAVNAIAALSESNYTLADVPAVNKAKAAYDALSSDVQEFVDGADKLENAVAAIGDLKLVAGADTLASGAQCDASLENFKTTVSVATGYGDAATISYTKWQWANFKYNSTEKIPVGTKVALGVYNALLNDVGFHWGDGATVYTNSNLATLKPGWNMITFTWEWDVNAANENYVIATHIYALSPVGSSTDMNGWKFTGLYTYTDETAFNTVKTNTIAAVDAEKEVADIAALQKEIDSVNLATLDSVLAKYIALTDAQKAKLKNAEKLEAYKNALKGTIVASSVDNSSENGSDLTVSVEKDETYGDVARIDHVSGWAEIKWNSDYEMSEDVYFVFYAYNPLDTDLDIAIGYLNDSQPESIFRTKYYVKQTLTAKAWTKVVVQWSAENYNYYMKAGFFRMIVAPAGTGTNISDLKMTSMFILTDETVTDAFIA